MVLQGKSNKTPAKKLQDQKGKLTVVLHAVASSLILLVSALHRNPDPSARSQSGKKVMAANLAKSLDTVSALQKCKECTSANCK